MLSTRQVDLAVWQTAVFEVHSMTEIGNHISVHVNACVTSSERVSRVAYKRDYHLIGRPLNQDPRTNSRSSSSRHNTRTPLSRGHKYREKNQPLS
jgi:hypothetical protein